MLPTTAAATTSSSLQPQQPAFTRQPAAAAGAPPQRTRTPVLQPQGIHEAELACNAPVVSVGSVGDQFGDLMQHLLGLCRAADRIRSGAVARAQLELWLQQECRDVLRAVDGATVLDLLSSHTYGARCWFAWARLQGAMLLGQQRYNGVRLPVPTCCLPSTHTTATSPTSPPPTHTGTTGRFIHYLTFVQDLEMTIVGRHVVGLAVYSGGHYDVRSTFVAPLSRHWLNQCTALILAPLASLFTS